MENYFMINGKKIPMSQETADNISSAKEDEGNSLKEVLRKLPKEGYFMNGNNFILPHTGDYPRCTSRGHLSNGNVLNTRKRCEQLQAIITMMNVADALNGEDDYYRAFGTTWTIGCYGNIRADLNGCGVYVLVTSFRSKPVYFKTKELAERAIKVLGKDLIRKAYGQ
ncbi:hypothetical protein LCGC14_1159910 [marine sediment metagenome]|uniref:Uncharacterized protein n=1 Tax=marine sediment metagenome TaxID=412755 RepID=A0A0F9PB80_9ZZZZ